VSEADPAAERSPGSEPDAGAEDVPAGEYPDVTDDGDLSDLASEPSSGVPSDGDDAAVVEAVAVAEAIAKERDEYLDLARRVQADFENYKRRVDQQRSEQRERAAEDLARELLPVLDAGEAAAAQGLGDAEQLHVHLLTTLEKHGLTRVADQGIEFDPNMHEAVIHEEGDEASPVVVEVLRTGYLWNDRVLRPAMVKVRG
jgi:molecular chaperone GrpE